MIYAYEAAQSVVPSGGYSARAVHFNGSSYLSCASIAATDNGFFSFSWWEKGLCASTNATAGCPMFVVDSASDYFPSFYPYQSPIKLYTQYADHSGNDWLPTWDAFSDTSSFVHILCTIDTNHAAGARIAALYINDTLVAPSGNQGDLGASFQSAVNGKTFMFGGDTYGDYTTVDVADVWIAPGVSLLSGTTIPEATRRQFINADLTPADPSGFPAAAVIFTGGPTTFATNLGTGGSFSLTGSLSSATPP